MMCVYECECRSLLQWLLLNGKNVFLLRVRDRTTNVSLTFIQFSPPFPPPKKKKTKTKKSHSMVKQ